MIKEPKNVDFSTTGKQPSEKDFAMISAWIKQNKQLQAIRKLKRNISRKKRIAQ